SRRQRLSVGQFGSRPGQMCRSSSNDGVSRANRAHPPAGTRLVLGAHHTLTGERDTMKHSNFFKGTLLAGLIVAGFQSGVLANSPPKLVGPMQLKPEIFHPDPITGTMTLTQSSSGVTGVKVDLDKPIMGRSSYSSSE